MWFSQEYQCESGSCGYRFDSLEKRSAIPESLPCRACGEPALKAISAVRSKTVLMTPVSMGKTETPPWAVDSRPLAEGMPLAEWKKWDRERAKKAPGYQDPVTSTLKEMGLK